jgi:uncharacterized membrane protein
MAKKEYTKLVIAIFDNEAAAQTAAENLKAWDKANDDVKAGAVGVLIADGKGGIKQDLVGPHATGKGATIGAILGLIAAIPTGGLSLLGGVLGGGVGGGIVGAFFHKHLGLAEEERNRLAKEIADGRAAVGVLAGGDEADAFAAKLAELGGKPESYEVTQEGVETAAGVLADVDEAAEQATAAGAAGSDASTPGSATESGVHN